MSAITSTIEIDRPPEEVFSYIEDPRHIPEWQENAVGVEIQDEAPVHAGTRFATTRRMPMGERTMTMEVTDDSPPSHWAVHGVDGPVRPDVDITVQPVDGSSRSRVTFRLDFEGHGIGKLIVPLFVRPSARRMLESNGRMLEERLEKGS
jgi:uncharacterized protein YndB with AHSA1/START domain